MASLISPCGENIFENDEIKASLKVLDPDDPLMKRFQHALKIHLLKINENLSQDISELTLANKQAEKRREMKGIEMYEAQREIQCQRASLEKYKTSLENLQQCQHNNNEILHNIKNVQTNLQQEVEKEQQQAEKMAREIQSLAAVYKQFSKFEEELSNHLTISKRMSEKDASIQRELIREKQEADYIHLKISEQVWKLENEIEDVKTQIKLKTNEKTAISQTITDADADLEALESQQKDLMDSWNRVVSSILQRDKIYEELSHERGTMQESFKTLQTRIEKVKKDSKIEMDMNERFSAIQSRLEEEIRCNQTAIERENEKCEVHQRNSDTILKLMEQTETEFAVISSEYEHLKKEETAVFKELNKLTKDKNILEEQILSKFEDKSIYDKTVKNLNKKLRETRDDIKEFELLMLQTENNYSKNLLQFEKSSNKILIEKNNLNEIIQINQLKEKELNNIKLKIEKKNIIIEKNQRKIADLNKKIYEKSVNTSKIDLNPKEIKITTLEKNINELEQKNKDAQNYWLRQESIMINLTEEKNSQMQEINRYSKYTMIMEQKNKKLEIALETEVKTMHNIEKRMNELYQRLEKTNTILAEQRDLKDHLKDQNFIIKDECTRTLQNAEVELIKMQNTFKDLTNNKCLLDEKLRDANREYLTWEKKVKLAVETAKVIKKEHNPGGDVAIMKNEIHKMEIRLSHLKKAQEKMIKDMELCVARREIIMNAALSREKKNPKGNHNKQVMFEKRMDGRKLKIKQIKKETKQMENEIESIKNDKKTLENEIKNTNDTLNKCKNEIIEIDKQNLDFELIKLHKLECLVRKQKKIKLLQKIRDGNYKIIKSEAILNDEMEKQKNLNSNLIEIMEQTNQDFPLLKNDIKKILLTLKLI